MVTMGEKEARILTTVSNQYSPSFYLDSSANKSSSCLWSI